MRRVTRSFLPIAALSLAASAAVADTAAPVHPIRIESGTYGANCGAREGNVTRDMTEYCNALDTCQYPVSSPTDYRAPHACQANLVAEWNCGAGQFHRAEVRVAGKSGGTLVLTCVPSTGPGR